jgi:predicted Zn-dependent protease with MMP-like domain
MRRERFTDIVAEALDDLPAGFRRRMKNIAVLVEDVPAEQRARSRRKLPPPRSSQPRTLVLGHFIGTATTEKSVFGVPGGPDHVILYQKNIEAVCGSEQEIREQIRLTLIHEVGHYFGMNEEQLRDV